MVDLKPEERAHLEAFQAARPDWSIAVVEDRWVDESPDFEKHGFPPCHPYLTGMGYVLKTLRTLPPGPVLDIGSPLPQSVAVAALPGHPVTVLDIRDLREAADFDLRWIVGTATNLPFEDASFPIVTSMWALSHVGDGRYGDELMRDGDIKMIAEIKRVLIPGGHAIIGVGLMDVQPAMVFNVHRIYSWDWLGWVLGNLGLEAVARKNLPVEGDMFLDPIWNNGRATVAYRRNGYYGVVVVKKPLAHGT